MASDDRLKPSSGSGHRGYEPRHNFAREFMRRHVSDYKSHRCGALRAGDSEYAAGQRLLQRMIPELGARFADYLVVDGGFATAPFLHTADDLGLPVVARLKGNLPELF